MAKQVELFLDEKKLGSWIAPPFEVTIPLPSYAPGTTSARRPMPATARKPTTSG